MTTINDIIKYYGSKHTGPVTDILLLQLAQKIGVRLPATTTKKKIKFLIEAFKKRVAFLNQFQGKNSRQQQKQTKVAKGRDPIHYPEVQKFIHPTHAHTHIPQNYQPFTPATSNNIFPIQQEIKALTDYLQIQEQKQEDNIKRAIDNILIPIEQDTETEEPEDKPLKLSQSQQNELLQKIRQHDPAEVMEYLFPSNVDSSIDQLRRQNTNVPIILGDFDDDESDGSVLSDITQPSNIRIDDIKMNPFTQDEKEWEEEGEGEKFTYTFDTNMDPQDMPWI